MPAFNQAFFVNAVGVGLVIAGLVLLWRVVLSPAARAAARTRSSPLPAWEVLPSDFMIFLWLVFCGGWLLPVLSSLMCGSFGIVDRAKMLVVNFASDGGMVLGVWAYQRFFARGSSLRPFADSTTLRDGAVTFLISLPVVVGAAYAWGGLLTLCGLPLDPQDAVDLFKKTSSPTQLTAMVVFATVVAPLTEELVFRAGIFRYARTRLPRWAALLLPACLFAALHHHLPSFAQLAALGIVFSLAYERTGRIGTAIVAHALFNACNVARIFIDPGAT
ncbi:MAG: CPBP family intramembrane metalloprotease [Verrucomicrobia bacterium]|nr:CPBP family intramembrane metalloprotease [Verrucomicrobiota bacterium]